MKNGFLFRVMALALCMTFLSSTGLLVPADAEKAPDKVGLVQVIPGGINATSFIRGKDLNAYVPARMMDGRDDTCWQFSTKDSELKETFVYISFDKGAQVDQLWIKNGFWKNTDGLDQYERNSRVKKVEVTFRYHGKSGYTDALSFTLKDETDAKAKDWQKLNLGLHENVIGIRMRVNSIYKGSKYKTDVCISEMMVVAKMGAIPDPSLYCELGKGVLNIADPAGATGLYARASQKLATRSGPGTEFEEKGTYQVAGEAIQILAKAYDINNLCWVQCRIPYHGQYVTAWTGWKRFDASSLDIRNVPLSYNYVLPDNTETIGSLDAVDNMVGVGTNTGVTDNTPISDNGSNNVGNLVAIDAPPVWPSENQTEERYYSKYPNGVLNIISEIEDEIEFRFSIYQLAVFEDLYAEIDENGNGTFYSLGDWDLSGTIIMTDQLIVLYLDDTPGFYGRKSTHEFIGSGVLVFQYEVLTLK